MLGVKPPTTPGWVPESTLSVESKLIDIRLKISSTPAGGNLLGTLKPIWTKTLESETRLAWLREMLEKKLVVRSIEQLGNVIEENLRVGSTREEELGRETLVVDESKM